MGMRRFAHGFRGVFVHGVGARRQAGLGCNRARASCACAEAEARWAGRWTHAARERGGAEPGGALFRARALIVFGDLMPVPDVSIACRFYQRQRGWADSDGFGSFGGWYWFVPKGGGE